MSIVSNVQFKTVPNNIIKASNVQYSYFAVSISKLLGESMILSIEVCRWTQWSVNEHVVSIGHNGIYWTISVILWCPMYIILIS